MEHAIHFSNIRALRRYYTQHPEFVTTYSLLYFGNEFCDRLLTPLSELEEGIGFAKEHSLSFVFVTPYLLDTDVVKCRALLDVLATFLPNASVVLQDLGILDDVKKLGLTPILGRMMSKQKQDPRIARLLSQDITDGMKRSLSESNLLILSYQNFLLSMGISHIEVNHALQGIIDIDQLKLKVSVYYPYVHVTTARKCPFIDCKNRQKKLYSKILPCSFECQEFDAELTHPTMPLPLLVKGNSHFFTNTSPLPHAHRLVYEPYLPM